MAGRAGYRCNIAASAPARARCFVNADGNYKADSFDVMVTAATKFSGDGDYDLARRLTGKRVGACPAPAAKG